MPSVITCAILVVRITRGVHALPWVETNRADIVARLDREGWICQHGGKHDKFTRPDRIYTIVVPRHRVLAMPTARSIAKAAGWL